MKGILGTWMRSEDPAKMQIYRCHYCSGCIGMVVCEDVHFLKEKDKRVVLVYILEGY